MMLRLSSLDIFVFFCCFLSRWSPVKCSYGIEVANTGDTKTYVRL